MATWSREDKAFVRELNEELATLRDGAPPILDALLPRLREGLGTERGMAFGARLDDGSAALEFASLSGFPARKRELHDDLDGWFRASTGRFSLYDPARPEVFQRNKPLWVGSYEEISRAGRGRMIDVGMLTLPDDEQASMLENLRKADSFCKRGDVGRHQQLRVLVCDGPALLAWVGVLQEAPFSARQLRVFGALVPALQRRLRLEQRLARSEMHEAAFVAALEALPTAAFLLAASGGVLHANALGRARLEDGRRQVDEELRASVAGTSPTSPYELTSLSSGHGSRRFLAVQRARPREVGDVAARARVRYGLTPRQMGVVVELLRGNSNKRIARELSCAERTVEVHVTAILEKTSCESRAELVARLWRDLG